MLSNNYVGTTAWRHERAGFALEWWTASRTDEAAGEHVHPLAHFMFISGGRFVSGARTPSVPRSPLIYNPPGTVHRDHFESARGRFFSISLAPEVVETVWSTLPVSPQEVGNIAAHAILARLAGESASWDGDSPEIVEALCFELIATLSPARSERAVPAWMAKATSILSNPHGPHVSLAMLSRELGLHRTHLTRTFRERLGCTPAEYARLHRLRRAAEMLEATDLPLTEVALASGFADQSHFTRHFRRAYGVAPGQYRRLAA